ncbi:PREDICTED: monothiol glutaredoxin-S10-like [Ipomoea nil]|uniref:monothiol glutaredoxin-S10-like n=1 Tax=Ipomoea nil TaxID=35883 RepID=UPI000900FEFD|nr:PREDICTED: monothiol glutaredoxin-S10-like [Ipomoea nil]
MDRVAKAASQNKVVIFTKTSCCMCHSIKGLFYSQGINPMIYELDEDNCNGREMERALRRLGCNPAVPAVFIRGRFVGTANTIMTLNLHGSLKNMLMDARCRL